MNTSQQKGIYGQLLVKDLDKKISLISENVKLDLNYTGDIENKEFYIELENHSTNTNWPPLKFQVSSFLDLGVFTFKQKKCLDWFTKESIYFLEIESNKTDSSLLNKFLDVYSKVILCLNKNVSLNSVLYQKNIINYRNECELDDLQIYLNRQEQKLKLKLINLEQTVKGKNQKNQEELQKE